MKKYIPSVLMMLVIIFVFKANAGDQDFTLVNETGLTINEFYCSPNDTDDWGDDILGENIMEDGDSLEVSFDRATEECLWDLMIVDGDGERIFWQDIDL